MGGAAGPGTVGVSWTVPNDTGGKIGDGTILGVTPLHAMGER